MDTLTYFLEEGIEIFGGLIFLTLIKDRMIEMMVAKFQKSLRDHYLEKGLGDIEKGMLGFLMGNAKDMKTVADRIEEDPEEFAKNLLHVIFQFSYQLIRLGIYIHALAGLALLGLPIASWAIAAVVVMAAATIVWTQFKAFSRLTKVTYGEQQKLAEYRQKLILTRDNPEAVFQTAGPEGTKALLGSLKKESKDVKGIQRKKANWLSLDSVRDTLNGFFISPLFNIVPFLITQIFTIQAVVGALLGELPDDVTMGMLTGEEPIPQEHQELIADLREETGQALNEAYSAQTQLMVLGWAIFDCFRSIANLIESKTTAQASASRMKDVDAYTNYLNSPEYIQYFKYLEKDPDAQALISIQDLMLMKPEGEYWEGILYIEDFELNGGEVVFLTGANGSGKTSTIRALYGMQPAYTENGGVVIKEGKRIATIPAGANLRGQGTTLREILLYGNPESHEKSDDEILEVLQKSGLAEELKITEENIGKILDDEKQHWPGEGLSEGQKRLLMLARTLLLKPDVIIVDEMGSNLDQGKKAEFFNVLQDYAQENNAGVVCISADDNERAYGDYDRSYIIQDGQLLLDKDDPEFDPRKAQQDMYSGAVFTLASGLGNNFPAPAPAAF